MFVTWEVLRRSLRSIDLSHDLTVTRNEFQRLLISHGELYARLLPQEVDALFARYKPGDPVGMCPCPCSCTTAVFHGNHRIFISSLLLCALLAMALSSHCRFRSRLHRP